jgi:hypothetical protein
MRLGPFKGRDGPLAMSKQPFLTSTAPQPLGQTFRLRQQTHFSKLAFSKVLPLVIISSECTQRYSLW